MLLGALGGANGLRVFGVTQLQGNVLRLPCVTSASNDSDFENLDWQKPTVLLPDLYVICRQAGRRADRLTACRWITSGRSSKHSRSILPSGRKVLWDPSGSTTEAGNMQNSGITKVF